MNTVQQSDCLRQIVEVHIIFSLNSTRLESIKLKKKISILFLLLINLSLTGCLGDGLDSTSTKLYKDGAVTSTITNSGDAVKAIAYLLYGSDRYCPVSFNMNAGEAKNIQFYCQPAIGVAGSGKLMVVRANKAPDTLRKAARSL